MSSVFNVDNSTLTSAFSLQVPILDKLYDLTPDKALIEQTEHESEVRSYPRRLPIAIKKRLVC